MIGTPIYLTEEERSGLTTLAAASGRKQSELIQEAVDRLLKQFGATRREAVIDQAAGMWKERNDLPPFETNRGSWDRS